MKYTIDIKIARSLSLTAAVLFEYISLKTKEVENYQFDASIFCNVFGFGKSSALSAYTTLEDASLIETSADGTVKIIDSEPIKEKKKRAKKPESIRLATKKDVESLDFSDEVKSLLWEFMEMRRVIKRKPVTVKSLKSLVKKIKDVVRESDRIAMIRKSIDKQWLDLYPIKNIQSD